MYTKEALGGDLLLGRWLRFGLTIVMISILTTPALANWEPACGTSIEPIYPGSFLYPDEVAEIHARLQYFGYNLPDFTGVYDLELQSVVRLFQLQHGLLPDGIVGEATWIALAGADYQWLPASSTQVPPPGKMRIEVDASKLRLTIYVDEKPFKSYPIAVGRPSLLSPIGEWRVVSKGVNWGGGFGTRWLGLNVPWGIYGIHGTNKPYSIGTRASHGCIRMLNQHVEEVYRWVSIGTPVTIVGPTDDIKYGRLLQNGTSGKDVVAVQMRLQSLGFPAKGADGRYGPASTQATRALQQLYGLPVDGNVYDDVYYILGLK